MVRIAGLVLGLVIGSIAVNAAQQIPTFRVSEPIECAFVQPAPSLLDAQVMVAETIYDSRPPSIVSIACVGQSSPFACAFPIAPEGRTIGSHTLTYRIGNPEFDGSISWGQPTTRSYLITPDYKGPPAPNSQTVIRRIGGG